MAKAYASCATTDCQNTITVIQRNRKMADSRAEYLSGRVLCDECKEDARRKENELAAEENKAKGMPELLGSTKQIAWAETIRKESIGFMNGVFSKYQPSSELRMGEFTYAENDFLRQLRETSNFLKNDEAKKLIGKPEGIKMAIDHLISTKITAGWWIDNRNSTALGNAFFNSAVNLVKLMPVDDSEYEVMRLEASIEATIIPENRQSTDIVEIKFVSDTQATVIVPFVPNFKSFSEFGYPARQLPYAIYTFNSSETKGDVKHQCAEFAAKMLSRGIAIRCFDDAVREMAVNGTYTPMHREWISEITPSGMIVIPHYQDDKLYKSARSIRGSKWVNTGTGAGRIIVPVSSYEKILSFAEKHGYKIGATVTKALDNARTVDETALITKVRQPSPVVTEKPTPVILDTIDPSLMDD